MNSRGLSLLLQRRINLPKCQRGAAIRRCKGLTGTPALEIFHSSFGPISNIDRNVRLILPAIYYTTKRSYAKKGGKKGGHVSINISGLGELIDVVQMKENMTEAVQNLKTEYVRSLSLRSAGSIEHLCVTFEGKEYELQQIAKMTRKGQQTIVVDMLSFPQMTKAVVEALRASALNLNPQQEGTTIYIPIPKVTKEHREILAKKAKALFIACRDTIKQVQEKNVQEVKSSNLGSTESQSVVKQVKAIADDFVSQAETLMKAKQEELLGK